MCGTGADCVPVDECTKNCGGPTPPPPTPGKGGWKCNWNATTPMCIEDKDAKMNKTECDAECHNAKYGKCDYLNDKCLPCTPGADDKECVYLMSYCKAAQSEGRCKEETLRGLFRMIETNTGWDHGEFDVEFRGGKMFI